MNWIWKRIISTPVYGISNFSVTVSVFKHRKGINSLDLFNTVQKITSRIYLLFFNQLWYCSSSLLKLKMLKSRILCTLNQKILFETIDQNMTAYWKELVSLQLIIYVSNNSTSAVFISYYYVFYKNCLEINKSHVISDSVSCLLIRKLQLTLI